jgi:hypothetical protein
MMETAVKDTQFFINRGLGNHFSEIQLVTFLEQTLVSFAYSSVEYCTSLHEESLSVA